jgi:hypothetical protein
MHYEDDELSTDGEMSNSSSDSDIDPNLFTNFGDDDDVVKALGLTEDPSFIIRQLEMGGMSRDEAAVNIIKFMSKQERPPPGLSKVGGSKPRRDKKGAPLLIKERWDQVRRGAGSNPRAGDHDDDDDLLRTKEWRDLLPSAPRSNFRKDNDEDRSGNQEGRRDIRKGVPSVRKDDDDDGDGDGGEHSNIRDVDVIRLSRGAVKNSIVCILDDDDDGEGGHRRGRPPSPCNDDDEEEEEEERPAGTEVGLPAQTSH